MTHHLDHIIKYYIGFKVGLIGISMYNHVHDFNDISILLVVNIISVSLAFINFNTLYDALCFVIEFFIGIITMTNWYSLPTIDKIIIIYNILPISKICFNKIAAPTS